MSKRSLLRRVVMPNLMPVPQAVGTKTNLLTEVRIIIGEHLGVDIEDISLNSHFADDLALDPLDVLELIILVEERFPNLRVRQDRELSFFGDLIEQIQCVDNYGANCCNVGENRGAFDEADEAILQ